MARKLLFLILLLFLMQGCNTKNQNEQINQIQIGDPYSWDFGRVEAGKILKHDFILKNESRQTLNIKDINTSCGCTVSKVKKKILSPGESTLIEVQFNTKDYAGTTQQFIYVHTDSLDASTALDINGKSNRTIDNPIVRYIIKADIVNSK